MRSEEFVRLVDFGWLNGASRSIRCQSSAMEQPGVGNIDTMPDLPLSPRPNMVTKQGLTSIDSALEAAGVASLPPRLVTGDREVLVKAGRDPEYFRMSKAIAKVPDERTPSVSLSNRSDQAIEAPRCPGSPWYASGM